MLDIEQIQAVVILCFWPLTVERQVEEPSWNYCGLITNAALKLGIHKATPRTSEYESYIWKKTWSACVYANCRSGPAFY